MPASNLRRAILLGFLAASTAVLCFGWFSTAPISAAGPIGREVAVSRHLQDGEEFQLSPGELIAYGEKLFNAAWTTQERGGRPLTKGTGAPLSDPNDPLRFPRAFNRVSGPDANSCSGCHNAPFGITGGGGDIVANVVRARAALRLRHLRRNEASPTAVRSTSAAGRSHCRPSATRAITLGMFGSGFIEMLARQMTADLQAIRDTMSPGQTRPLHTKDVSLRRARPPCRR